MSSTSDATMVAAVRAGTEALDTGDLPTALEHFKQVIESFPDRPEGHNNLGALYAGLGENAQAEACFNRVLVLLPHNANVLYNRGVARIGLEKFDSAYEDFTRVVTALPEDPEAHNNLGVAAFMRGAFDEAQAHLRRAMGLREDYATALLNLCDVMTAAGNAATAAKLCQDYLRTHPDAMEVRRHQFRLLTEGCQEALAEAGRAAEEILAADEQDTQTRREWGCILEARDLLTASANA